MALSWITALEDTDGHHARGVDLARRAEDLKLKGRFAEAEELFETARQTAEDGDVTLQILCGYAHLVVTARRASEACALAAEMQTLVTDPKCATTAPWGYAWISQLLLLANRVEDALVAAGEAVHAAETAGVGLAEAFSALSAAQERAGDIPAAIDSLETAMMYMTSPRCLMDARANHARLALQMRDIESATRSLTRALELLDLRDRLVLGNVMKAIASVGENEPKAVVRLVETLAVHLTKLQDAQGSCTY